MNTHSFIHHLRTLFKQRRRRTLYLGATLLAIFLLAQLFTAYYQVRVPQEGGSFSEGIVGYPRFVNPVLALSQTDKDLSRLIFSGLFRYDENGKVEQDLAQSYEVNASSTEYTVLLRDDIYFHNGDKLTTQDVAYTYNLIRDPVIKSPLFSRLHGVTWTIENEHAIRFNLANPDTAFLQTLTFGILDKEQWSDISTAEFPFAPLNISPIGAGPYMIQSINRNKEQRITSYILQASPSYPNKAYIKEIETVFYPDQDAAVAAFEAGLVDNLANISPLELLKLDHALVSKKIQSYPLSRNFALFFNQQNNELLQDKSVRSFIRDSINKETLVSQVLLGRAEISDSPLPLSHPFYLAKKDETEELSTTQDVFEKLGYTKDDNGLYSKASSTLHFTLHVPQVRELEQIADSIANDLREKGVEIEVIAVDQNSIINDVIRPRSYELLIFGQLVDDPQSLYSFWHSSGIDDPGINVSGLANKTIDTILERLVEEKQNEKKITTDYHNLQKIIRDEVAAVFLYHPHFIYAMDTSIRNAHISHLNFAWDRFNNISDWYIKTESLIPWFIQN